MRNKPDTYTGNSLKSVIVPNAFSVESARRDECESRESRPGGETSTLSDASSLLTEILDLSISLYILAPTHFRHAIFSHFNENFYEI